MSGFVAYALAGLYLVVSIGFYCGGSAGKQEPSPIGFAVLSLLWPVWAATSFGEDLSHHLDEKWGVKK